MLDGRAHLLAEKSSTNLASVEFLQGLSQYQSKIDSIHKAVEEGDVRRVKSLIDRHSLATSRDRHGRLGGEWGCHSFRWELRATKIENNLEGCQGTYQPPYNIPSLNDTHSISICIGICFFLTRVPKIARKPNIHMV